MSSYGDGEQGKMCTWLPKELECRERHLSLSFYLDEALLVLPAMQGCFPMFLPWEERRLEGGEERFPKGQNGKTCAEIASLAQGKTGKKQNNR